MCCSIDTTRGHACDRRRIPSWSVDAGFILALPLHYGDLELDSVGVLTKAILVAWPWLVGPICEIKIPVQELRLKM